ncbi:LLM class flavin-dependent oxidoreductase [Streptomyces wedmorensis]|uniref:LLM class flavin-dependent oxidoreductase n=1 Tax=Streptomyces wedmorensis TaxID=43759 RepID=A0ABW6J0L2_STRWE
MGEYLWYIPNTVEPGHRGDDTLDGWDTLDHSTELARAVEQHGWAGALLGTGWGRPDTFTVAASLAARTTTFKPLIAIRPGYWHPANFASASATLDRLSQGRVLVNIVSGLDDAASYGDGEFDQSRRYERTLEFLQLVRRLWNEEQVTFHGEHYRVDESSVRPRPWGAEQGLHPRLYFGGASAAAERVAAQEADVQLFWGEPLDGIAGRIDRLRALSETVGRTHRPLEFGLRITTLVRDTTEEAWRAAEEKVARMAQQGPRAQEAFRRHTAVGQQRLLDLAARGDVLDSCLYTAPGRYGGGGAGTTWLVGSAQEVADALRRYRALGVTHFVLSDTPYKQEIARVGDGLLPLLKEPDRTDATPPAGRTQRLPAAHPTEAPA